MSSLSTLDDIFGQDEAIASLRRAYEADRLPHGLIFAGPVGVGKATTAAALAALFLCPTPQGIKPCGTCESCRAFAAGSHPDHHVITRDLIRYHDKTGTSKGIDLSINVIRPEFIEPANRTAAMNHGKVFIIEQAETMSTAAQNAILKTLEEPISRTLIILLTDQPDALLPTVRSRCRMVRFGRLEDERVLSALQRRGIDPKQAASAVALVDGSLGLAIKWLEDDVISHGDQLLAQVDALVKGRLPGDLPAWFKQSAEAYAEKQLDRDPLGSKDQATRDGLAIYLGIAAQRLRSHLRHETDEARLESLCAAIDSIARAQRYLDSNVSIPLAFQQLAVTLRREFVT